MATEGTGLLGLKIGFALSLIYKDPFALVHTLNFSVNKSWYFCFIFFFKILIFLLVNFTN